MGAAEAANAELTRAAMVDGRRVGAAVAEGPDVYKLADAGNQGDGRAEDALGQEIHSAIAFHGGGVDVRSGRDRPVRAQAPIHV